MEEEVGVMFILRAGRPEILVQFPLRTRNLSLLTSCVLLLLLLFARHVKEPWVYVEAEITGKIDRPFLAHNSIFR